MGRPRTGRTFVEWHCDHWDIRIELSSGERSRRSCMPPATSKDQAKTMAQRLKAIAWQRGATKLQGAPEPENEPSVPNTSTLQLIERNRRRLLEARQIPAVYAILSDDLVKIGHTGNLAHRASHYLTHNPKASFVAVQPCRDVAAARVAEDEWLRQAIECSGADEIPLKEWFYASPKLLVWLKEKSERWGSMPTVDDEYFIRETGAR